MVFFVAFMLTVTNADHVCKTPVISNQLEVLSKNVIANQLLTTAKTTQTKLQSNQAPAAELAAIIAAKKTVGNNGFGGALAASALASADAAGSRNTMSSFNFSGNSAVFWFFSTWAISRTNSLNRSAVALRRVSSASNAALSVSVACCLVNSIAARKRNVDVDPVFR